MSIRYEWADDDQIILYITVEDPWTWAEYLNVARTLKSVIDALDHPCATIIDATRYGSLPKDGNAIHILLKIDKLLSENIFASALVGAPSGVIVFINMMMRLRPRLQSTTFFTQTVEDAHARILERYQQIRTDNS